MSLQIFNIYSAHFLPYGETASVGQGFVAVGVTDDRYEVEVCPVLVGLTTEDLGKQIASKLDLANEQRLREIPVNGYLYVEGEGGFWLLGKVGHGELVSVRESMAQFFRKTERRAERI